jgi:hypothetical protein
MLTTLEINLFCALSPAANIHHKLKVQIDFNVSSLVTFHYIKEKMLTCRHKSIKGGYFRRVQIIYKGDTVTDTTAFGL